MVVVWLCVLMDRCRWGCVGGRRRLLVVWLVVVV